jgi:hypothetical protein
MRRATSNRRSRRRQTVPVRLPMLESGVGDRQEKCRLYEGCLDRWVKTIKKLAQWHGNVRCPTSCEFYRPVDQRQICNHEAARRDA